MLGAYLYLLIKNISLTWTNISFSWFWLIFMIFSLIGAAYGSGMLFQNLDFQIYSSMALCDTIEGFMSIWGHMSTGETWILWRAFHWIQLEAAAAQRPWTEAKGNTSQGSHAAAYHSVDQ